MKEMTRDALAASVVKTTDEKRCKNAAKLNFKHASKSLSGKGLGLLQKCCKCCKNAAKRRCSNGAAGFTPLLTAKGLLRSFFQ